MPLEKDDETYQEMELPLTPANDAGAQGGYTSSALFHVSGEVKRLVFESRDTDYAVIRLTDSKGQELTLVGPLKNLLEGQSIEAEGKWEQHQEHGRQFRVTDFRAVLPTSKEGIRRYLASGVLPGIGETYAERIVEHFGADTLNILDKYSERLKEVPGIGKKRIHDIRAAWTERNSQRETEVYLHGLGLSSTYCLKIERHYGMDACAEIVRRNPYRLAEDIPGIGFLTADKIAAKQGIAPDDPMRLRAGIEYALADFQSTGHVCVTKNQLFDTARQQLNVTDDKLETGLQEALACGRIVSALSHLHSTHMFFTRKLYQEEVLLAEAVNVLLAQGAMRLPISPERLGDGFARLNTAQKQAVRNAFNAGFSIVTGGPGVGKTTVVGQIVAMAKMLHLRLALAAPTGRAAKRMAETTHEDAVTIHRLLKWDPQKHAFTHGPDMPLDCQMLIVDEVSMLDTTLACSLFRAVRGGTHVVLVGDKDQLPSVGPGAVLHDLIACGRVPIACLTEIYRQAGGSRIITNAHAVNSGAMPDCRPMPKGTLADFYWVEQPDPAAAADLIARLVTERIPKVYGFDPMTDVQILSPMRKGDCGTLEMNARIQNALNPPDDQKETFMAQNHAFRTGDRVMQIRNNYDKGVFNGEQGHVLFVDRTAGKFTVQFDSIIAEYGTDDCDELTLAYAVTVHKSQGSEYPVVILPLLNQHYIMLQRNLVYTGMTRAKKLLIMVGTYRALGLAVRNDKPMQRQTMLVERLKKDA